MLGAVGSFHDVRGRTAVDVGKLAGGYRIQAGHCTERNRV